MFEGHGAKVVGDPKAPKVARWAPRSECVACGAGVFFSAAAWESDPPVAEEVFCFGCSVEFGDPA